VQEEKFTEIEKWDEEFGVPNNPTRRGLRKVTIVT
jgi:hypothetical protein